MAKIVKHTKEILVYADWKELDGAMLMGTLYSDRLRGKEIFSFTYSRAWLEKGLSTELDPDLGFYSGPQYMQVEKINFGLFTDSAPDRWGRVLMERREALSARLEDRKALPLFESDFLLGVYDKYRMGALRFKLAAGDAFLNDNNLFKVPPFTSLRTLEEASLQLENSDAEEDPSYTKWLSILLSPGSSLGGARPKASVADPHGQLWIAKFPSTSDRRDIGGWEVVVNELAKQAGIKVAEGTARRFTQKNHTFLTKRFDRKKEERIHFASAMTLLGQSDGANADSNVSYLHLAEFIMRHGVQTDIDLEELWKRIVFYICISNSDDHLRNHGFLLTQGGWMLSPAFDINPVPNSSGLSLNISENSNALDLELAREVAQQFRVQEKKREQIINKIINAVIQWKEVARKFDIKRSEINEMETAFY